MIGRARLPAGPLLALAALVGCIHAPGWSTAAPACRRAG
jgi:hypothetical protein